MNQNKIKTIILASLFTLGLSGCDSIPFMNNTPDYKGAGRSRPLEVPPDLTSISSNDTYTVPGGSTTYSEFSQGQVNPAEKEKILPTPESVHLERAGSQRWLVVDAAPEKVWPVIREFWADLGFAVRVENTDSGVMETEWVDPSSLTKDDKGNYLDKFQGWLDRLNTLANRQKFRTRLDRGNDQNTTEIYMSHRAVSDTPDDGKVVVRTRLGNIDQGYAPKNQVRTKEDQERADGEDLDAELLRRLMVKLGIDGKYPIISSGTKIKFFYCKKNAFNYETIGFIDYYPKELLAVIKPDYMFMFNKNVVPVISRIFNVIGWPTPAIGCEEATDLIELFS